MISRSKSAAASVETVAVAELIFDFANPRLPEFELTGKSTDSDVIKVLWDAMDVRELVVPLRPAGSSATSR